MLPEAHLENPLLVAVRHAFAVVLADNDHRPVVLLAGIELDGRDPVAVLHRVGDEVVKDPPDKRVGEYFHAGVDVVVDGYPAGHDLPCRLVHDTPAVMPDRRGDPDILVLPGELDDGSDLVHGSSGLLAIDRQGRVGLLLFQEVEIDLEPRQMVVDIVPGDGGEEGKLLVGKLERYRELQELVRPLPEQVLEHFALGDVD